MEKKKTFYCQCMKFGIWRETIQIWTRINVCIYFWISPGKPTIYLKRMQLLFYTWLAWKLQWWRYHSQLLLSVNWCYQQTCNPFHVLQTPPQTDYEGQAKKLMEFMEQTDMLIVAGGDGTLQEVITGLLRRPDQVGLIQ